MTTKESEVDVLAVMEESVAASEVGEYPGTALALADARAAVAEAFEAAEEVYRISERKHDAWDRLRTALRNAGVKL
ncbi:hypothetical protein [Frateuria terrea]|uniref:Uncharacterized protein n=1 Tax=Frateuria terrea TaxID=529704 RepID=A0A1H6ZML2_9GAMM|nr:hypothetical protein [Frateuria terrea]SEJ54733.1 hypothetical protein SAMN04487997_0168 [Frateuria terrea]SFP47707.1 hypothetical protein SAMN02927913_2222 [Frateuria terrea]